jgi:hypothetical protein
VSHLLCRRPRSVPLATRRSSGSRPSRRPRRLDTDSHHGDHATASTHAGSRDPRRCVRHPFSLSLSGVDKIRQPRPNLCGSDREYNKVNKVLPTVATCHSLLTVHRFPFFVWVHSFGNRIPTLTMTMCSSVGCCRNVLTYFLV